MEGTAVAASQNNTPKQSAKLRKERDKVYKKKALDEWELSITAADVIEVKKKLNTLMEGNKFGDNNKYESVSQSQFQCFHTCPKGNAGRQENSTAYGEHVNKQKNDKEYVCSCMNAETNACKLKLWFCNADCPFTKFEKHAYKTKKGESVHLDIGWQNPIQFKDQQTIGDLTYNLSSHVKSTWHGFWHAVNVFTISGTANTMTHPTKDAHNNSHIRKYRQVRDLLAFYAMANYHVDDNFAEVKCEINDFLNMNAQHFKNAQNLLKVPDNPWIPSQIAGFTDLILNQVPSDDFTTTYRFGKELRESLVSEKGRIIIQNIENIYGITLDREQGVTLCLQSNTTTGIRKRPANSDQEASMRHTVGNTGRVATSILPPHSPTGARQGPTAPQPHRGPAGPHRGPAGGGGSGGGPLVLSPAINSTPFRPDPPNVSFGSGCKCDTGKTHCD